MRINGYDDLIHRYSRTAEALKNERASGFDGVLAQTAEKYASSQALSGQRDPFLAFASRSAGTLTHDPLLCARAKTSSPGYDPVLHYGDA